MSQPIAILHTPKPALGACILAGVERDTRGCSLTDAQRFNYFPVSPMVVISWVFEGDLHLVQDGAPGVAPRLGAPLPRLLFSGPHRRPSMSWSPGPLHALSVGFYPEALRRLMGLPVEPYLDCNLPLQAVAPAAFLQACQAVLDGGGIHAFAQLQTQLQPLWDEPAQDSPVPYLGDWVRALATRAAHSSAGRSVRQLQRLVRDWTGQSQRDLQLFIRADTALQHYLAWQRGERRDLASVAADAGFADQSHMGRDLRRLTGLSPARLGALLATDEAFWYYRLIAAEMQP